MIRVDGHASVRDIVAVATAQEAVDVAPGVHAAIAAAHDRADELAARRPTYGRTTGVGANRLIATSASSDGVGLGILRSHAADAGAPVPPNAVRAMLAVRLNQLCVPGSGIHPSVLDGLVTMLNDDALPAVLQFGSIGTGDLTALAGTALTLMGERPASRPLAPTPAWGADSALAFISSSALTIGRGCLSAVRLSELESAAELIFGLSFVGLRGNADAVSAKAATVSSSGAVPEVAARIRSLLGRAADEPGAAARIQDPFGLRVFGIAQAGLVRATARLLDTLGRLVTAGQENPIFDFAESAVVHHGAFYQTELALDVDAGTLAIAHAASIAQARLRLHNEPEYTGLRPFLADGPPASSGIMILEYIAASAIAELRSAAQPASMGTISLSRGTEDDASFATQGVVQLERAVDAYEHLLTCELVAAIRLLRQQDRLGALRGPLAAAAGIASALPHDDADRDLRTDLAVARTLLPELAALVVA